MPASEFTLIYRYFSALGGGPAVDLSVGDDCALLRLDSDERLATSVDTMVSGVHFPDDHFPEDIGYRAVSALLPAGEPIVIPRDASDAIHYENELVVVIGKTAKHLSRDDALSCVLGYTIGNDMSERTWQAADRTFWRSKNTDTFKPMGPWLETDFDPDGLTGRGLWTGQKPGP